MRWAFAVAVGLFAVLAAFCSVKAVTVVPDQRMIIRWVCAALAFALVAVFWDVVRRRYVARGSLRADPVQALLGGCAVTILIVTMVVFAATG